MIEDSRLSLRYSPDFVLGLDCEQFWIVNSNEQLKPLRHLIYRMTFPPPRILESNAESSLNRNGHGANC